MKIITVIECYTNIEAQRKKDNFGPINIKSQKYD